MNIRCSVCKDTAGNMNLVQSRCLPGARFISCIKCRENKFEPRPLVVLGSIYANSKITKVAIKDRLYVGEPIMAEEIMV